MKSVATLFVVFTALALFNACYYDVEESIYPCNSDGVTYDAVIAPIIEASCISCHSGAQPRGKVSFESKELLSTVINDPNSKFLCRINWESGCNRMPETGDQLSACAIQNIETWITAGMP